VGYSLLFPALALLAVQRVGEQSRGAALGFFTAFFDAGMGLGAPFAGAMAVLLGYGGMFLIAALVSLAGGALTLTGAGAKLAESRSVA
jgi:predicted MFS family arabinose efflux permease